MSEVRFKPMLQFSVPLPIEYVAVAMIRKSLVIVDCDHHT
jgi:hypothetical protein